MRTFLRAWYDSKATHTSVLRLASVGVLGVLGCVGTNQKAALFTEVAGYKQSRVMVVGIAWTATQHTPAACQSQLPNVMVSHVSYNSTCRYAAKFVPLYENADARQSRGSEIRKASGARQLAASVALHCRVSSSNQRRILRLPCVRIEYILARSSQGRNS